ncbi:MAG: AraC family transcriptional regulator [Gammaproteobacteria bacterium]
MLCAISVNAQTADVTPLPENLDKEIQSLKKEMLNLNRELFILEEELLFPSNTQISVFLSVDSGTFFELDAIEIKLDDKVVSHYLYTRRELDALQRGGVHRVYMGNLPAGTHELVAFFIGKGSKNRDYKRGITLNFEKKNGPKYIELKIRDSSEKQQPEFIAEEWE